MTIDAAIVDYSAALLLRYFRRGDALEGNIPRVEHRRDLDLLRGHWSISRPVRALVSYLLSHPHEAQSLLVLRTRTDDAVARGRIDARQTWLYRLQTGLPSAIVAQEPIRSFLTGPNLLLAWVLREAATYTARLSNWQSPSSPYVEIIERAQGEMRSLQRLTALREPLRAVALGQRPGSNTVRVAARSRRLVYRLAVEAYELLQGIERGEASAIEDVARTALLGPLEEWRRFEIAVGLGVAEALAEATGAPMTLSLLGAETAAPIATAGRFAVYWQQRTPFYSAPAPEPSEVLTRDILAAYNLAIGSDRPDLVVVDQSVQRVVSIIEVKYVAGDTAPARFRDAVDQVVRYARGYAPTDAIGAILSRSLVAISRDAPALDDLLAEVPGSIDFEGIKQKQLAVWAARLVAEPLPSPSLTSLAQA
ncbi:MULTISPECIES: hypothetical protein [unclassified Sphingopyxis]|uniref:hypothetical protein n=1 Tax=unclassified Sphingopyxis TaxID=2614943 RepID=UPI002865B93A|nr:MULTISPECIES: hypothetical protein [unclassified Sphingopyxis]MDR7062490.1 hypothetical protein [Sphingopyxis sp. BE235]MDR7182961.1 hypothetical protein [Sphingopyxis sp. BE249]